jgi:hypothetical protein
MIRTVRKIGIVAFTLACIFVLAHHANAYSISTVNINAENDFVLEPGKAEFFVEPGQTVTKDIKVTNRTDRTVTFRVQVEDFIGSSDPLNPVILLEGDTSPYSFRNNLRPEVEEFTLKSGQQISLPISIEVPANQAPGGYYSSVLVSNQPTVEGESGNLDTSGRTRTVSRLGVLFFVRVNGPAEQAGGLEDFRLKGPKKLFYPRGPFNFEILFNNTGIILVVCTLCRTVQLNSKIFLAKL